MSHRLRAHASLSLAAALLALGAACGSTPEKLGDACDVDDQDCPGDYVCAAKGDEDVCQIPKGGSCELGGTDWCVGDAECLDDGQGNGLCATVVGEGGDCDPDPASGALCDEGLTCAVVSAGGNKCFKPVTMKGKVFDAVSEAAIEGAHVIAFDATATAITDVAISDATGNYALTVPVPRTADGAPDPSASFTLRASAQDYQTFPGGLRTALPISGASSATDEVGYTIQSTLTDISLIPLPDAEKGNASISGKVVAEDDLEDGVLVVAENAEGKGISAVSDRAGLYTIFNVPDGSYSVKGYAAGLQVDAVDTSVANKAAVSGVDLLQSTDGLGTITGSVNIVNAPGGSETSVVLVVRSTFSDTFVRGEVPRGLRSPLAGEPNVSGGFTIEGVPEGEYVALAAFENDLLVRDPDQCQGGTEIVYTSMARPGSEISLDAFKVTEALAVVGPGANEPEAVTSAPTLSWADDSSEDFYTVVVYDAYGELAWCRSDAQVNGQACDGGNVPGVSGAGDVEVAYGGPMEPGMYYQFRVTSWRQTGGGNNTCAISASEDLRGVFYVDVAN